MQKLLENEAGAGLTKETSTSEDEELTPLPKVTEKLKHGDIIMVNGEKKRIISRQGEVLTAFPLLHEDGEKEEWDEIPVPVVSTKNNNKSINGLLYTLSQDIKNRTITKEVKTEKW